MHTIAQTPDGYLWLGTEEGLARFDGFRFTIFDVRNSKGLPDNYIVKLLVTHDGVLWVATRTAVLQLREGAFHPVSQLEGLLSDDLSGLCEGPDGTIWITTAESVNRLQNSKIQGFRLQEKWPKVHINSASTTPDGALWLGTSDGLIRLWRNRFTRFDERAGLPSNSIEALAPGHNGVLWVSTRKGLMRWQGERGSVVSSLHNERTDHVAALLEDKDGNVWIEGNRSGLTRLQGNKVASYSKAEGLPSDNDSALFEDRDGNLWIGFADDGLAELRDGKFTNFGKQERLSSNILWSMLEARDGSIWAGTDDGGLDQISKTGQVTVYSRKNGLPGNAVFGIAEGNDGSMWAGMEDGWIARIQNGSIKTFRDEQSKTARVVAIHKGPGNSLWVAFHEKNGLTLFTDGHFVHYPVTGLVNALYPDGQGGLWIGTDHGGVSHWRDGKVKQYTAKHGLLSDFAQAVYVDREATVWVGTSPGGLNRIKNGKITSYSVEQGLFNETVGAIIEDDSGYLWMTCNKGIYKVRKQELNDFADHRVSSIHSIVYGTADGLRSPECDFGAFPSIWKSRDRRLWFATSDGIAVIDPNRTVRGTRAASVLIEGVLFDQKEIPNQSGARLGPERGRLEIRFAAPNFIAPERARFRYRLSGFETNWNDSGAVHSASYTNLPPGKYRFLVQSVDDEGVWNPQDAVLDFEILPHIYQQLWFYGICILFLIYAGQKVHNLRTRYLVRRNEELENRVAERTAELEQAMRAAELAREALREQATRDGLTGLWNRSSIFEILEKELVRSERENQDMSVIMADLDHFKSINDTYGHLTGDVVLREACARIGALMRPYDSAGRYGGEEILIVLPNCSLVDAKHRAEELRAAVHERRFDFTTNGISVTCSFGVASSVHGRDSHALVAAADLALYLAKAEGRNRVEVFVPQSATDCCDEPARVCQIS